MKACTTLLAAAALLAAQETETPEEGAVTTVIAQGVGAITESKAIARDRALSDALRNAVEQGAGAWLGSETAVENFELLRDKIYSKASGYVTSYEIIKELEETELYRVWIKANVKGGDIKKDLAAIGILVQKAGRPRVTVVIDDEELQAIVEDGLVELGFPVVDLPTVKKLLEKSEMELLLDGNQEVAKKVGALAGVEIVLFGRGSAKKETKLLPYTSDPKTVYTVNLKAKAVEALTGEILAAFRMERSVPFSQNQAYKSVGDSAVSELSSEVLVKWQSRGNVLHLVVTGSKAKLAKLRGKLLENVRGVKEVYERGFVGNFAIFEIICEFSPQSVIEDLRSGALGLSLQSYEGNRATAKLN